MKRVSIFAVENDHGKRAGAAPACLNRRVRKLKAEDVRAFMQRDWAAARRIKDESIGRRVRAKGATEAFRLAQMLLDQVWDRIRRSERRRDVSGLLAHVEKLGRARA